MYSSGYYTGSSPASIASACAPYSCRAITSFATSSCVSFLREWSYFSGDTGSKGSRLRSSLKGKAAQKARFLLPLKFLLDFLGKVVNLSGFSSLSQASSTLASRWESPCYCLAFSRISSISARLFLFSSAYLIVSRISSWLMNLLSL
jgi:hypothetical protein